MQTVILALAIFVVGACANAVQLRASTDACQNPRTGALTRFDSTLAGALAGIYRLSIVSDWEDEAGRSVQGTMTLQATDTLHERHEFTALGRWRPTDRRPLWGWADLKSKDVTLPWGADPASRDPEHPGILLHSSGALELGVWRGLDGSSVTLTISAVSAQGLYGTWDSDLGIAILIRDGRRLANPHGHFCATRL